MMFEVDTVVLSQRPGSQSATRLCDLQLRRWRSSRGSPDFVLRREKVRSVYEEGVGRSNFKIGHSRQRQTDRRWPANFEI